MWHVQTFEARPEPVAEVIHMASDQDELSIGTPEWAQMQTQKILEMGSTSVVDVRGLPVVLLTSRGAKSGKLYKTPLLRVEYEGAYAIVGSLGGAPRNPSWYYNVKAYPRVLLQDGTVTKEYDAREVTGEEKVPWWKRATEIYPRYAEFQERTTRVIPLFVLEEVCP
jgi:deazaflavin-dependent oxidoreductase (nitroreductase family)